MCLSVSAAVGDKILSTEVYGPVVQRSERAEASPEDVRKRLMKTGGTQFTFTALETELAPGVFLPVGQLNALRRDALSGLEDVILSSCRRAEPPSARKRSQQGKKPPTTSPSP